MPGTQGASRFPILVWYHGGSWVIGDLDTADGPPRHLCVGADCVAVSVDFPLAPETKFPGPDKDCYAATQWAVDNAAAINGGPARVAVGGDSAAETWPRPYLSWPATATVPLFRSSSCYIR